MVVPIKANKHPRPPVVMTQHQVQLVLNSMKGTHLLMARPLDGRTGINRVEFRLTWLIHSKIFSNPNSASFFENYR